MGLVSLIMGNNSSVKVINKIPMGGIVCYDAESQSSQGVAQTLKMAVKTFSS